MFCCDKNFLGNILIILLTVLKYSFNSSASRKKARETVPAIFLRPGANFLHQYIILNHYCKYFQTVVGE